MDVLENEKTRLLQVVKSLEEKIKLLEMKISEITVANHKVVYVLHVNCHVLLNI